MQSPQRFPRKLSTEVRRRCLRIQTAFSGDSRRQQADLDELEHLLQLFLPIIYVADDLTYWYDHGTEHQVETSIRNIMTLTKQIRQLLADSTFISKRMKDVVGPERSEYPTNLPTLQAAAGLGGPGTKVGGLEQEEGSEELGELGELGELRKLEEPQV
jgi:hypothetical protein